MPRGKGSELDRELADLAPEMRWRTWMARVEAVIFAAPAPVGRETLAVVVGRDCRLDDLVEDIREELRARPYELVAMAGGWQLRTRKNVADALQAVRGQGAPRPFSPGELEALACIAWRQPITRGQITQMVGREVSRDVIASLKARDLIVAGPKSPTAGAPNTWVTTKEFLIAFGLETLGDLPDPDDEAGILSFGGDRPWKITDGVCRSDDI